jgi:hypothetical protein
MDNDLIEQLDEILTKSYDKINNSKQSTIELEMIKTGLEEDITLLESYSIHFRKVIQLIDKKLNNDYTRRVNVDTEV